MIPFAAAILSFAPQASAPAPPRATAFVDVTVIPMDRPGTLEHRTVIVRGGRVASIAAAAETQLGDDVVRVEGRGKFLMPGLADMHVHTWSPDDFSLFLANGVTTVRNMFGSSMHLAWKSRIAAGELLAPNLVTAGPIVDGAPPVWPGSDVVENAEDAERVVAAQKAAGYDLVKVYSRLTKPAYDAVLAAAKKHGMPADGHVPDAVGLDAAFRSGQRSFEHLMLYGAATQAADATTGATNAIADFRAWPRFDPSKAAALAKRTAEAGVWTCPTLVVMQRWGSRESEDPLARPEMRYVSPMMRGVWKSMADRQSGPGGSSLLEAIHAGDAGRSKMVRALHDAGAHLVIGTDMGNPYVVAGFSVHEEIRNFADAGIPPFDALRAATAAPAEMLGVPKEFGTVTAGARADLLLLDANPLADVSNTRAIAGVMVRGRWIPAAELQATLDAFAERYAPPSSAPR